MHSQIENKTKITHSEHWEVKFRILHNVTFLLFMCLYHQVLSVGTRLGTYLTQILQRSLSQLGQSICELLFLHDYVQGQREWMIAQCEMVDKGSIDYISYKDKNYNSWLFNSY